MAGEQVKPWFSARRYGYGAGLPIAWQGWLVLAALLAMCLCAPLAASMIARWSNLLAGIVVALPLLLLVPFVRLCKRRTVGGWQWRWRWGER